MQAALQDPCHVKFSEQFPALSQDIITAMCNAKSDLIFVGNYFISHESITIEDLASEVYNVSAAIAGGEKNVLALIVYDRIYVEDNEEKVERTAFVVPYGQNNCLLNFRSAITNELNNLLQEDVAAASQKFYEKAVEVISSCDPDNPPSEDLQGSFDDFVSLDDLPEFNQEQEGVNDVGNISDFAGLPSDEKAKLLALIEQYAEYDVNARVFITKGSDVSFETTPVDGIVLQQSVIDDYMSDFNDSDVNYWIHYDEVNKRLYYRLNHRPDLYTPPENLLTENGLTYDPNEVIGIRDQTLHKVADIKNGHSVDGQEVLPVGETETLGFFDRTMRVVTATKDIMGEIKIPDKMWRNGQTYVF